MRKFKSGDVVKLKSDHEEQPIMTVVAYLPDLAQYKEAVLFGTLSEFQEHSIQCVWRDTEGTPYDIEYHEECLESVEP